MSHNISLSVEKVFGKNHQNVCKFVSITLSTTNDNSAENQKTEGFAVKLKKLGKYLCLTAADASQTNYRFIMCFFRYCDPERLTRSTKSNQMIFQKRAVLHMASGYAGAWLLVFTPFFVYAIFLIITNSVPDTVEIFVNFMTPLQDFFTFFVFMPPKVRATRENRR